MSLKKWSERTAPPNVKPEPSRSKKLTWDENGIRDENGNPVTYPATSLKELIEHTFIDKYGMKIPGISCKGLLDTPKPLRGKDPIQEEVKRLQDNLKQSDMVNHPSHYNAYPMENLETIRGSMSEIEYRGFLKGTIEKYLYRYDLKGKPAEDLKKARFYLDKLIERVGGKE